jgi:hypothetical protein
MRRTVPELKIAGTRGAMFFRFDRPLRKKSRPGLLAGCGRTERG